MLGEWYRWSTHPDGKTLLFRAERFLDDAHDGPLVAGKILFLSRLRPWIVKPEELREMSKSERERVETEAGG